jgi:two-component system NarL family sensor kinase
MVSVLTAGIIGHYRMLTEDLRGSTMKRYEDEVRHIVETMTTTIEAIVPSEIGPDMDRDDRKHVINLIHEAQYGHPNGYFFMFDMDGTVIAQRIHRGHEGMNRFHEKDVGGKLYVQELIEAAKRGGDFVKYMMEKPGQEGKGNFPKIAYAKMLRGNRWWVGSGVYMDTIDAEILAQNKKLLVQVGFVMILSGGFLVGVLWIAFRLSAMLGQQITEPIAKLAIGAKTLSVGGYGHRVSVDTQDEFKELAEVFNTMGETIGRTISDLQTAQEESKSLLEQNRALTDRERTLVEEERKRIARELHDDIGQKLVTLELLLYLAQTKEDDNARQVVLVRAEKSIQTMTNGIRRILQNLRPVLLDGLGFSAALRVHLEEQAEAANLKIDIHDQNSAIRLPSEVESNLFRVVQEAMANVVRHAHAHRVDV